MLFSSLSGTLQRAKEALRGHLAALCYVCFVLGKELLAIGRGQNIAAEPEHAIAQLEQELGDPFIQYAHGSGLRHVINDMFAQIDASPNVAYESQEDQVIAGLVAQGFGVSIVSYMEMLLRLNVKILQISRPVPNRIIYLVTAPAMMLSPTAADFKRFGLSQSELA